MAKKQSAHAEDTMFEIPRSPPDAQTQNLILILHLMLTTAAPARAQKIDFPVRKERYMAAVASRRTTERMRSVNMRPHALPGLRKEVGFPGLRNSRIPMKLPPTNAFSMMRHF